MSDELTFDGRVAVVTGGGRGLGRTHALLLASRGARVVVNDLGTHSSGSGSTPERAERTATEIVANGGTAIAHFGDVSSEDARDLVQRTVGTFGRLDILVNNAGILAFQPLFEMSTETFERFLQVHVGGSFLTTQAAWPHMIEHGYGRVVMTSSVGMFGPESAAHYAAAKGGVFGLMRAVSVEGRPHGIAANGIVPAAVTPVVEELGAQDTELLSDAFNPSPELVSPVVAWLAHEDCSVTGELFHVGFGWVGRIIVGQGPGYADPGLSMETVRDHWEEICAVAPVTAIPSTDAGLNALMQSAPPMAPNHTP